MDGRLTGGLAALARRLPRRNRVEAAWLLALISLSAAAELLSLGTILLFLKVLTGAPVATPPILVDVLESIGARPDAGVTPFGLAVAFGATAAIAAVSRIGLSRAMHRFAYAMGAELSVAIYSRTLHQPYRAHLAQNTSETVAGINKAQMLIWQVLLPLMAGLSACIIAAALIVGLFIISPRVALIAGPVLCAAYLLISSSTRSRLRRNSALIATAQTQRVQAVREGLGGIRDLLTAQAQPIHIDRFARIEDGLRRAQADNAFLTTTPRFFVEAGGMIVIAAIAAWLSQGPGGLSGGLPMLGAALFGAHRLLPLMQQMYGAGAQLSGGRQSIADVMRLLDREMAPGAQAGEAAPLPFEDAIRLRAVGFRYDSDKPPILRNVNLTIPRGSIVGIMGKTGSGKSTLVDLVTGLLEPTDGSIEVDGRAVTSATLAAWRRQIAHVSQVTYLMDATIAENTAFGVDRRTIDMDDVRRATHIAGLDDLIGDLPQGFETVVGERGARLSGGQQQRIGIARALYKKSASVLVFDEATSALDDRTEGPILKCLNGLRGEITIIMIAHRESSLRYCDVIYRLDDGDLVEISHAGHKIVPVE